MASGPPPQQTAAAARLDGRPGLGRGVWRSGLGPSHLWPGSGAVLALLLAAGCSKPAPPPRPPLAVRSEPARPAVFRQEVGTVSTLEAPDEVNLAAQAGGRIEQLRVRQGDQVKRGQLLVVLDQTQLQAEVVALQGQRNESLLNYRRFEFLARTGAASVIQRDALRQNWIAAESALKAKQADLAYRDLRSPVDGYVSDVRVNPGDVIKAGDPFTTIQRNNRLLARVEVPARYGPQLRNGQAVILQDPLADRTIAEGQVRSIDPRVSSGTQGLLVKAELDNPDGSLRTGQRLRTRLVLGSSEQLSVPFAAVTQTSGQNFVFVVGSLEQLERQPGRISKEQLQALRQRVSSEPQLRFALQTPVQLGPLQSKRYPVLRGLSSGQQVIVTNLLSLRHGAPVQVN